MIEFRLSGGAGNTLPASSLGGIISATQVVKDTASFHAGASLAGITLLSCTGMLPEASGGARSAALTLSLDGGLKLVYFSAYGAARGVADANVNNIVNVGSNGTYEVSWVDDYGTAGLTFSVVTASLPGVNSVGLIDVVRSSGQLFDDIPLAENLAPVANYRCVYAKNTGSSAQSVQLYTQGNPSGSVIDFGLDPAGINVAAQAVATELTAPAGVTFANSTTPENGVPITLAANDFAAIWIRRVPLPMRPKPVVGDNFSLLARIAPT